MEAENLVYFKYLWYLVLVGAYVLYLIHNSKKRQKQSEKLLNNDYKAKFKCKIISAKSKTSARAVLLKNWGVRADIVLYENNILFITGRKDIQTQIKIIDIDEIYMTGLLWAKLLYIRQAVFPATKNEYDDFLQKFYLSGDKEELLYIKDFVEKRKNGEFQQG